MEITKDKKPTGLYQCYTADEDTERIIAHFTKRHGYKPEEILLYARILWVGPVRKDER